MANARRSSSDRVRAYRERMREQGLRPITIWVPDVTSPEFQAEARRQARAVAESEAEREEIEILGKLFDEMPWWQDNDELIDGSDTE